LGQALQCHRLAARNAELVGSYWPLVERVRGAEAQAATATEVAAAATARRDALDEEVRYRCHPRCQLVVRWEGRKEGDKKQL
jgi:hypothetical protein